MKRVVLVMISIAMVMTLAGCRNGNISNEKVLNYLNKRYAEKFDDEFEIKSSDRADIFSSVDKFFVSSKQLPDYTVEVAYQNGKLRDNYMALHYTKDCQEALEEMFEPIIGECTVVCDLSYYTTSEFNANTTFDEFFHSNTNSLSTNIIMKDVENFSDSNFDLIIEKIKEANIPHNKLHFVVLNEYKEFDNAYQLSELVNEEKYPYVESRYIALNNDFEVTRRDEGLACKMKEKE